LVAGLEYVTSTLESAKSCLIVCPGLGAGVFTPCAKAPNDITERASTISFLIKYNGFVYLISTQFNSN
jgi:hypothetical protein